MKELQRLSCDVHESLRSSTFLFDLSRLVEELVYNSLDAGSTKVVISLNVGSCYVKVEDDGCGVTRDGLVILGERYVTSKVDLLTDAATSTETLGFRGEALSSVSNISLVEIRSKARGKPNAYCKIIKSSKCLFFGIDDQREDVGTTVIVRDLFYNQPIRRKLMQSSIRKVLHHVKKSVFRIALVHPQVSFQVFEIEGELKLLCTIPSLSSLPLVTDGFGNEVSSSLQKVTFSGQVFNLSGYISGPTDAFLTKVLQYIYINSRFICKGPIHNFINSLATSFQSNFAKLRDNSENHHRKRQKTQGYPAYLLNLSCPMSSYDLSFEPSKTRVEFQDWGAVILFFEQSIMPYWKQFSSKLFQGEGSAVKASYIDKGIQREALFSEDTTKSSKLRAIEDNVHFHQGSFSNSRITNPLNTFIDDAYNCQTHNLRIDDQEDYFSFPKSCHIKDYQIEVVDSVTHHEVDSLHGDSRYLSSKRCGSYADDAYHLTLACDCAPSKTYPLTENERINSACCSTGYAFGENHDFLKELISDKEECATGANWYNECKNVNSKMNLSNNFFHKKMNSQQPVIGVIKKCQKLVQQDTPRFKVDLFSHDQACSTEETTLGHGKVADYVDADSRSGSSLQYNFTDPFISRAPPRVQDFLLDSTLIRNHVHRQGAYYKNYAIEENNAEFLDAILDESCEILPDCIDSTMLNYKFCSSPMESPSEQFIPKKSSPNFLGNEEKGCLLSESSSINHAKIYSSSFINFGKQNYGDAVESPSENEKLQNPLSSNGSELRLRRSHSAPPFYQRKKKFPILNCLPTCCTTENSTMKPSHVINKPGLNSLLEPFSTSPPCMKPFIKLSQPHSREFKFEKSSQGNTIAIQSCNGFDYGSATDEFDPASALLTKWRPDILQPTIKHNAVIPHEVDVLDVSSGLLHLSGDSLVPASLNKGCFENAKVLQQLDRKFIPVIASGTLVIIDQHAADERIRLEDLRKKVLHGELCSCTYLNPVIELTLPEMGYQLLHKYEDPIKKWGWICNIHSQHSESFERSMNVLRSHNCTTTLVAVPRILGTDLMGKDLLEYIEQLVETDGSSIIPPAVIRLLNYKACRGAIMFGDALLPSECSLIVEELKATSLCFQCAHGRPTTVPLLNMPALHQQLARLGSPEEWHGLRRHTPSIRRARQRLELCKHFQHG